MRKKPIHNFWILILDLHELQKKFYFDLPAKLIAQNPVHPPESCRLLHIKKNRQELQNRFFFQLPQILQSGDLLVVNNSKVEARRIFLLKKNSSSSQRFESIFLQKQNSIWQVLLRKSRRLDPGDILYSEKDPAMEFIVSRKAEGFVYLQPSQPLTENIFSRIGQMPIPPYLQREENESDRKNYQTIFSQESGSVAAPTAALHFSKTLLADMQVHNIEFEALTLHVGYGTFAPLKEKNFQTQKLHPESYFIPPALAERLQKKNYNRLIAVGTTSLRVLETVFQKTQGKFNHSLSGVTDIFLYPPHSLASVDGLITNFHLPASSLFLLTACMLPPQFLLHAYRYAVQEEYRFYSYGDAMLIES